MNLTDPYIFRNQSLAVRLSLVLVVNIVYALIFRQLYPFAGDGIGALAIIPAAIGGWLLGGRLGLVAGLLSGLLNLSLYSNVAGSGFNELLHQGLPSLIVVTLGGGLTGWLSDLLCQLKKQTNDLTQKQSAFQEEIAQHQHVEKELRHQQEILQSIFDNIPLMIAFYDSTGKLLFLSRELERALGWSMEELRQIDLLAECYPDPDYRQKVIEFMIAATREWRDFKTRTKDGRIIDTSWANIRLSDGSNIGIGQDITERKQAEEKLETMRHRYELATQAGNVGVWDWDIQTGEFYLDPNVKALLGYSDEEIPNDLEIWSNYVHSEDRQAVMEAAQVHLDGQSPEYNFEHRMLHKDGSHRWILVRGTAIRDAKGQAIRLLGTDTDISDRKQAEEVLAYARDQALEASRLKSQILAKVSHELRTPLNGILGFAEMLEFGTYGPITIRQQDATSKIIKSTHYLTEVVGELLDQARLESGKMQLNLTTFAPKDVIERVQAEVSVLAQTKGLSLITEIAPDVPQTVWGDLARVRQVLSNLVGNAIKFTEQGSVCIKVCCPDETSWDIQVADTGPGIPIEDQPKIFDPFQQVDGSLTRKHGGYGLGLSIVKQLTTMMGGQVRLKSEVGHGSTFTVSLPLGANQ